MKESTKQMFRTLQPYVVGGAVSIVLFILLMLATYTITHRDEGESSDSADSVDTSPDREPVHLREDGTIRTILVVEGCEYITRIDADNGTAYYGLEHRTRCRNPLHHPGMMSDVSERVHRE